MQHADTEYMGELEEELQTAVLEAIPVERRLRGLPAEERLRGLPAEERLRGLPAEERLRGLSSEEVLRRFTPREVLGRFTPEELAGGLSDEQAERLRELLEQKRGKRRSANDRSYRQLANIAIITAVGLREPQPHCGQLRTRQRPPGRVHPRHATIRRRRAFFQVLASVRRGFVCGSCRRQTPRPSCCRRTRPASACVPRERSAR